MMAKPLRHPGYKLDERGSQSGYRLRGKWQSPAPSDFCEYCGAPPERQAVGPVELAADTCPACGAEHCEYKPQHPTPAVCDDDDIKF